MNVCVSIATCQLDTYKDIKALICSYIFKALALIIRMLH